MIHIKELLKYISLFVSCKKNEFDRGTLHMWYRKLYKQIFTVNIATRHNEDVNAIKDKEYDGSKKYYDKIQKLHESSYVKYDVVNNLLYMTFYINFFIDRLGISKYNNMVKWLKLIHERLEVIC